MERSNLGKTFPFESLANIFSGLPTGLSINLRDMIAVPIINTKAILTVLYFPKTIEDADGDSIGSIIPILSIWSISDLFVCFKAWEAG